MQYAKTSPVEALSDGCRERRSRTHLHNMPMKERRAPWSMMTPACAMTHTEGDTPRKKILLFKNSFRPECTGATHKGTVQQGHTEVSHPPCIPWQHWSSVTHVHIQYGKQRSVNNDRIRDGAVYDYLLVPEQEEEALRILCQMLFPREVHFLHCFYDHSWLSRQEDLSRTTLFYY